MSEYIVMPENSCFLIGDHMTYTEAAISEPLAIGVYAVNQSIPMKGATIGILGFGPIGMSVLLPAFAKGASKIYVTDLIDERLNIAKECGANWTGNPAKENVVDTIKSLEPLLLDVVFECCGKQEAMDQAIELLKPGGKLVLLNMSKPNAHRTWFETVYEKLKFEPCRPVLMSPYLEAAGFIEIRRVYQPTRGSIVALLWGQEIVLAQKAK